MMRRTDFVMILIACFALSLHDSGLVNTAFAVQDNAEQFPHNKPQMIHGKVTDVIDVSSYTYAEVDTGKEKVWAAGPPTSLRIGDMVSFTSQMPMQNFHSKSTGRDFPVIYFINNYITDEAMPTAVSPHTQVSGQRLSKPVEGINKVEGGYTIAEIYSDKSKLSGKTIRVRGQVTKFSANIMGMNWFHIIDSSSLDDLTVTSASIAAVGDVVIAEGKLELDKDYKYGYLYPVIIEHAVVTKE